MPNGNPWWDPHGHTEGHGSPQPLTEEERDMLRDFFARNPHPPWLTDTTGRYYPERSSTP